MPVPTTAGASLSSPARHRSIAQRATPIKVRRPAAPARNPALADMDQTHRTGKMRPSRVGHQSGAHTSNRGDKIDAQNHACPRDGAGLRGICGRDRRCANYARGQQHRRRCRKLHSDPTGGLPRMGALLPAGIRAHVRPVSLLVSPLLVIVIARARPAARPRPLFDRATATI